MIENSNKEETASLHQNLGLPTAISTVVGCVIGSGIFFKPQAIYTVTGGAPGLGMLAWVITGLVSIAAALTFAEIAVLFPETGGIPTYLSQAFWQVGCRLFCFIRPWFRPWPWPALSRRRCLSGRVLWFPAR